MHSASRAPLNSSGVALAKDVTGLPLTMSLPSSAPSVHRVILEHVDLGESASVEFGAPMYGVKRRKRTRYLSR